MFAEKYIDGAVKLIEEIKETQLGRIREAARIVADCVESGGVYHLFGSGHSHMIAEEVNHRAGTMACANALSLSGDYGRFERVVGFGKTLARQFDLRPGDVLFVISNSGINPAPIEVAQSAREKGLKVIVISSIEEYSGAAVRDPGGKRLHEYADLAVDSRVPYGDAAVEIPGVPGKVGPLSTIAGVVIINAIVVEAAALLKERGVEPPVRISRNIPGGDENNLRFVEMYGDRIPGLRY